MGKSRKLLCNKTLMAKGVGFELYNRVAGKRDHTPLALRSCVALSTAKPDTGLAPTGNAPTCRGVRSEPIAWLMPCQVTVT